jgi:hypothetical protein
MLVCGKAVIMPVISHYIFQGLTGLKTKVFQNSLTKVTGARNQLSQSAQ